MSQGNVEYARRAFQAFNERGLAGAAEFWHPQIVWQTDPSVPEPGTLFVLGPAVLAIGLLRRGSGTNALKLRNR